MGPRGGDIEELRSGYGVAVGGGREESTVASTALTLASVGSRMRLFLLRQKEAYEAEDRQMSSELLAESARDKMGLAEQVGF